MTEPPATVHAWGDQRRERADSARDRFRHNLGRLMAERGITQASLARTLNVSRVAVHAWIWGTCFPETSRLIRLAEALSVPIGALLDGSEPSAETSTETSTEEALLLNAFRKLPNTARLTLLAGAYELSAQIAAQARQLDGASPTG